MNLMTIDIKNLEKETHFAEDTHLFIEIDVRYKIRATDKYPALEHRGWGFHLVQVSTEANRASYQKNEAYKQLNDMFFYTELDLVATPGYSGFFAPQKTKEIVNEVIDQLQVTTKKHALC